MEVRSMWPQPSGSPGLKPQSRESSLTCSPRQMRLSTGKKQRDASRRLQEKDELHGLSHQMRPTPCGQGEQHLKVLGTAPFFPVLNHEAEGMQSIARRLDLGWTSVAFLRVGRARPADSPCRTIQIHGGTREY